MLSEAGHRGSSRCVSPGGTLTFVVEREAGDVIVGFEGTPWHTHGDLLACAYGTSQEEAVAAFIEALLQNRTVIAVASVRGIVSDVWVTDEPFKSDHHKPEDEVIAFRFWDVGLSIQATRSRQNRAETLT
jgi:hypothetical protein